MVNYKCENCEKNFNRKSNWEYHITNKKRPCNKVKSIIDVDIILQHKNSSSVSSSESSESSNTNSKSSNRHKNLTKNQTDITDIDKKIEQVQEQMNENDNLYKKLHICRYCCKEFTRIDNLSRHIINRRCEILKLQKQQKENIFVSLLKEEEINNDAKTKLNELNDLTIISKKNIPNQIDNLIKQVQDMKENIEQQKIIFEQQKKELEVKLKNNFEQELDNKISSLVNQYETKSEIITNKYDKLEKNNIKLQKINLKLQNKMDKIVNKNKYKITTNSNNIQTITNNTVINNPTIKLVEFGKENLKNIDFQVFIDAIKSQGAGLYNKAIEGIHFNIDYPENQNIYISDLNRERVMIYKDEKWIIDNWETIFNELLEKVIQFGYSKEEFLLDCDYKIGNKKYNKQIIKNGMRWFKLLDESKPDVDYFELEPEDRPEIDYKTYQDYLDMQEFRAKHPKKETETHIKNKTKINMYNKRDIPINNYKNLCQIDMSKIKLIE